MGFNRRDAKLKDSHALPSGASTVSSAGIDLGLTARSDFLAECELLLTAPALAVGQLADASTMKYTVQDSSASDFGTNLRTIAGTEITQTGAGGAGAAGATRRIGLPTDVQRYIRFQATNSAAADASGATATLEVLT
jgi:hypothetical protein